MKNYEDYLSESYENKAVGVAKLATIDDMIQNNLMFFISDADFNLISQTSNIAQILETSDNMIDKAMNDEEFDSLVLAYKKEFKNKMGMFSFSSKDTNQYNMMLFDPSQELLESLFKGGIDLAKKCPLNGNYVLYLDCLECDKKDECKRGELKNESSK